MNLSPAYRRRIKAEAFERYGKVCAVCGESDTDVLQLHHINGDGGKHRREAGGIDTLYLLHAEGWPDGIEVLCKDCHKARHKDDFTPAQRSERARRASLASQIARLERELGLR